MWNNDLRAHSNVDNLHTSYLTEAKYVRHSKASFFAFPRVENANNSQVCGAPNVDGAGARPDNLSPVPVSGQSLASSTHVCERRGEVFSTASAYFGASFGTESLFCRARPPAYDAPRSSRHSVPRGSGPSRCGHYWTRASTSCESTRVTAPLRCGRAGSPTSKRFSESGRPRSPS